MAASAISPSSSPRLPSPPPIAEDQLGPKSPIAASEEQQKLFSNLDHGAARRIRPGTKAEDMAEGPPLVDLSEIDSAFQLTEHLKALHNFLTHPIGSNSTIAVDKDMAHKLAQPPENVDRTLWLYELCRFLTQKVNSIIIALFSDNPPCSSITCPEMRASEWQYLCAVHDPPKSCCAIDYCCHTLDWAANTLTSPKTFPSRLALGTDQATQHQQIRHLTNIFRRVYRIFAHAWFQHRDMFWKVETRSGLYILFKTVCDVYGLIPEDNYTIPSEAEGQESTPISSAPTILRREAAEPQSVSNTPSGGDGGSDHSLSAAGTTKRHRHSPSVSSTSFSTVMEENEDEDDPQNAQRGARTTESHVEPGSGVVEEQSAPAQEGEENEGNAVEETEPMESGAVEEETQEESASTEHVEAGEEEQTLESAEEEDMNKLQDEQTAAAAPEGVSEEGTGEESSEKPAEPEEEAVAKSDDPQTNQDESVTNTTDEDKASEDKDPEGEKTETADKKDDDEK